MENVKRAYGPFVIAAEPSEMKEQFQILFGRASCDEAIDTSFLRPWDESPMKNGKLVALCNTRSE